MVGRGGWRRDVEDVGAARGAEAADERRRCPPEKARPPLRDRLLQEQGPLLAFRRVRSIPSSLLPLLLLPPRPKP